MLFTVDLIMTWCLIRLEILFPKVKIIPNDLSYGPIRIERPYIFNRSLLYRFIMCIKVAKLLVNAYSVRFNGNREILR